MSIDVREFKEHDKDDEEVSSDKKSIHYKTEESNKAMIFNVPSDYSGQEVD